MPSYRALIDPEPSPFIRLVQLACNALDAPFGAFAAIDLERHYFRASVGLAPHQASLCVPLCAAAMFSDLPVCVSNLGADKRFQSLAVVLREPGLRSYAAVSVRNPQGLPVGTFWVADTRTRQFSESFQETLASFGNLAERELLLRMLARTDALTGLQNRSYFDQDIDREWRRARRGRHSVTALMIDVDHMADFNEQFTFERGDQALQTIADLMLGRFRRASDLLIRVSGDRILALLPETELEDGTRLGEDLRREIEAVGLGNPTAGTVLTVSIGAATATSFTGYHEGFEGLIHRAGAALRRAKSEGRNRLCTAEDDQALTDISAA